jgi:hypothetical protein
MGIVRDIAELVLLVLIWWDGRNILKVERATHQLYEFYVNERRSERAAKMAQLAAARAAKAAKKEAQ